MTLLVEKLGRETFSNLVKIDFEEKSGFASLFDSDIDPLKRCSEIEIRTGQDIIENETLLFF